MQFQSIVDGLQFGRDEPRTSHHIVGIHFTITAATIAATTSSLAVHWQQNGRSRCRRQTHRARTAAHRMRNQRRGRMQSHRAAKVGKRYTCSAAFLTNARFFRFLLGAVQIFGARAQHNSRDVVMVTRRCRPGCKELRHGRLIHGLRVS